jgi:fluoride exporter
VLRGVTASITMQLLMVALGGALGGATRFVVGELVQSRIGGAFPLGTLVVNVTGALAIGIAAGMFLPGDAAPAHPAWTIFVVGLLGSYTTVSSFSLQTLELWQLGAAVRAALNVLASFALCLAAAAAGIALASVLR